ncbi:hypothetical protein BKA70DRAFT_208068 [Coprinopsis sp. MPI-PUGE-AT-0042]|nr:hypothetical protein BKA70DRAFT_208068 [Coprinopsis sp. MPI-PUGE-AT-0042]
MGRLRILELTVDSTEAMAALSYFPHLQTLTVAIASSIDIANKPTPAGSGGFPSLVTLECTSHLDLSPCLWTVGLLAKSSPLKSLTLLSNTSAPLQTMVDIIELLPIHVDCHSLAELHIRENAQTDLAVPSVDAATELLDDPFHLESLGIFHALSVLRIETITPISTGLVPLRKLRHLNLKTLVAGLFNDIAYGRCVPKIKLLELVEILKMFPCLETLGLPIDATDVPTSWKRPGRGFEHGEELLLFVGSSPINSPREVAALLSDVVPRLDATLASESIVLQTGGQPIDNPNFDKWVKVQELVPFLYDIREQERNTAECGASESDEE